MRYAAVVERTSAGPIIVCPLDFEREALRKAGVSGRILCIGPGERGVERLPDLIDDDEAAPVILAGVAGAIDGSCLFRGGAAFVISEVIGEGVRWEPPWQGRGGHPTAKVATSREVLTTPQSKREFADRTGAQLVDQESAHFAHLATACGWNWGIVRGVSDDLSTSLPPDVHNWVTDDGRTRVLRVIGSCIVRPNLIAPLFTIQRNSARALRAVAAILKSTI